MSTEIKYALRYKKKNKLLGYYISSNADGDFCCDSQYILSYIEMDNIWFVDSPEKAEWVRHNSTLWYNADYNTPTHEYEAKELEVVKVKITTDIETLKVKIPTFKEMAKWKCKGNKNDYEYHMLQKKEHPELNYTYYDLIEMLDLNYE